MSTEILSDVVILPLQDVWILCSCGWEFFSRSFLDTNKLCRKYEMLNEVSKNIIKDMNYNESIKTSYTGFSFLIEALKMVRWYDNHNYFFIIKSIFQFQPTMLNDLYYRKGTKKQRTFCLLKTNIQKPYNEV